MPTQCNAKQLQFSGVERRRAVAAVDGGTVSSNAGALLVGKADAAIGLVVWLAVHPQLRRPGSQRPDRSQCNGDAARRASANE